jgi:predicted nucleotidyltransferase
MTTEDGTTTNPTKRGGLPPGVTSGSLWEVAGQHNVVRLRLVGAWARGEANPGDPVEIIVGYAKRPTTIETVRLQHAFERVTGLRFIVREESSVSLAEREVLRREARML